MCRLDRRKKKQNLQRKWTDQRMRWKTQDDHVDNQTLERLFKAWMTTTTTKNQLKREFMLSWIFLLFLTFFFLLGPREENFSNFSCSKFKKRIHFKKKNVVVSIFHVFIKNQWTSKMSYFRYVIFAQYVSLIFHRLNLFWKWRF